MRILILIINITLNIILNIAYAEDGVEPWLEELVNNEQIDESETKWAEDIANRDRLMVMNHFKKMLHEVEGFDPDLQESILNPRPNLQIFVSTSMPRQLLRAYAKEASRYEGVLVFRGLPQGSFRKLTDLVMDISDEKHECAMQIDDEAFADFNVQLVPAIILSQPVAMFDTKTRPNKFDKVQGNITIKAALELFASKGDLARDARGMLK